MKIPEKQRRAILKPYNVKKGKTNYSSEEGSTQWKEKKG